MQKVENYFFSYEAVLLSRSDSDIADIIGYGNIVDYRTVTDFEFIYSNL